MKVLITGATGFIGQHLLEELKNDDFSIRIITRSKPAELWCSNRNFETHIADISDASSLAPALQGVDVVINLAAERNDAAKFYSANIKGVENIIALAEKYNIKKIIHLSSVSVFGMKYSRKKVVVGNAFACHPKTEYGITKLKSEMLLNEFGKKSGTEIIILRANAVFGEHQPSRYLAALFKRVKSEAAIPRHKNTVVNYVYVKDVIHAVKYFLQNNNGSKTIIVGESISFPEFIASVSGALNVSCKIKNVPSFLFDVMEAVNYFGMKKLKAKFHSISNCVTYDDAFMKQVITYKYGIDRGVRKTIEHDNLLPSPHSFSSQK